jgi:flagellar motility protein MotE (MotC chaperone)
MKYVIDELSKSLRYHMRQLEDNLRNIEHKKEAVAMLEEKNQQHEQAIQEINHYLDELEKAEIAAK